MALTKRTIPPGSTQQTISTRPQSNLDWNTRKPQTPRREYAFMREYSLVWSQSSNNGSFGPFNGGVAL